MTESRAALLPLSQLRQEGTACRKRTLSLEGLHANPPKKKRKLYRPLAGAILGKAAAKWFKNAKKTESKGCQTSVVSIPRLPVGCRSFPVPWGTKQRTLSTSSQTCKNDLLEDNSSSVLMANSPKHEGNTRECISRRWSDHFIPIESEGVTVCSETATRRTVATNTSYVGWRCPSRPSRRRNTWLRASRQWRRAGKKSDASTQTDS